MLGIFTRSLVTAKNFKPVFVTSTLRGAFDARQSVKRYNNNLTLSLNELSCIPQKNWWTAARELFQHSSSVSLIPTLKELTELSVWFIKRTFRPSLRKRKNKHGFLKRTQSVGGRRVLNRRQHKKRLRLAM